MKNAREQQKLLRTTAMRDLDKDDSPALAGSAPAKSGFSLRGILLAFASLKLTVALLAAAIFIVFAGTMAQTEKGFWQVTDEYFRVAVAWIDLRIFFPRHWFPSLSKIPGTFPFPGGWLIGFVMAVNLLAAHSFRFKLQARGSRAVWGGAITALGALLVWLTIKSGTDSGGGALSEAEWSTVRLLVAWLLGGLWVVSIYAFAQKGYEQTLRWWAMLGGVVALGLLFLWASWGGGLDKLNDSSLRILWQLLKASLASVVLLGGCVLLFRKRAGIVLIHAGVGLLMLGELYVGTSAVEGNMQIEEGQTSNFVEENRYVELAIVKAIDSQTDEVVAIPQAMLKTGAKVAKITHADLPVDITIEQYFPNSKIVAAPVGVANPATAGLGLQSIARPIASVGGAAQEINMPSMYITLTTQGASKPLGTYLLALLHSYQGVTEKVTIEGVTYNLSLRYKRTYKPYSIRLNDFRDDKYLGTATTKNFSSDIRLVDKSHNVDREVRIWMNNPLRYAGETFYQSGHTTNPVTGAEVTILQVVTNAGWMMPYVSCMMVATGMLAHFWNVLLRFLQRRKKKQFIQERRSLLASGESVEGWSRWVPTAVVVFGVALLASVFRLPSAKVGEMNFYEFGKLPVVYEGRVKPFDTLARNSLSVISDKQSYRDAFGDRQPAVRWLLDVIANDSAARAHRVFRIENLEVLQTLGLKRRDGLRYAIDEFAPQLEEFDKQSKLARSRDKQDLSVYQKKILELDRKIRLYLLLDQSFYQTEIRPGHERDDLFAALRHAEQFAGLQPPLAVPVGRSSDDGWQMFSTAWLIAQGQQIVGGKKNRAAESLTAIFSAYAEGDAESFNQEVAKYQEDLRSNPPSRYDAAKTRFESAFNQWQLFFWCSLLYVLAFVLTSVSWLGWFTPLRRSALGLIALTWAVHTVALVARVYISGRPPVTNLYSSAVFIGWAAVGLGMVLEWIYRIGIGNILASAVGFATLLVAHFLSRSGDTFVVLQAVLDTQFWLATHVVCITLGYSTTFVAGGLGLVAILRDALVRSPSPKVGKDEVGKELARMIYGSICFAMFFSFVGTVLGGLWADDSWGRFWGWDPKENGALMIVLWNALVLHARWAGLVKERGLALLAVGGNICTAWSWFGTNELGVGLHSYGFTEGVLMALGLFCLSQLAVIAIGLWPRRAT